MSTCGLARAPARLDQGGQAVQGLRAEHHIDVRRARHDGRALLAGDTAADAYEQAGTLALQVFHAAQVVEHFLLRLLAHRAGVEQDDVGLGRIGSGFHALGSGEHVGHLGRVVLVHLAAESLDVELLRHAHCGFLSGAAASSGGKHPDAVYLARAVERVFHQRAGRQAHRHDDQVVPAADLRAGGQAHRLTVDFDHGVLKVDDVAALGAIRDLSHLRHGGHRQDKGADQQGKQLSSHGTTPDR